MNYNDVLKKQIPKRIIIQAENDREYEDYICPSCKNILQQRPKGATEIIIKPFRYCWDCGQALSWNKENKEIVF